MSAIETFYSGVKYTHVVSTDQSKKVAADSLSSNGRTPSITVEIWVRVPTRIF